MKPRNTNASALECQIILNSHLVLDQTRRYNVASCIEYPECFGHLFKVYYQLFYNEHRKASQWLTKPPNWHERPAKAQISLGIHPVWSEFFMVSISIITMPTRHTVCLGPTLSLINTDY